MSDQSLSLMSGPVPPPWLSPAFIVCASTVAPWAADWRFFMAVGPCGPAGGRLRGGQQRGGGIGRRCRGRAATRVGQDAQSGADASAEIILHGRVACPAILRSGESAALARLLPDSGPAARHRTRAALAERTKAALNEAKRKLAERDDKNPRPLTILATERGRHGPSLAFVRRGATAAKRRA